jgi:hypothetical protein
MTQVIVVESNNSSIIQQQETQNIVVDDDKITVVVTGLLPPPTLGTLISGTLNPQNGSLLVYSEESNAWTASNILNNQIIESGQY